MLGSATYAQPCVHTLYGEVEAFANCCLCFVNERVNNPSEKGGKGERGGNNVQEKIAARA